MNDKEIQAEAHKASEDLKAGKDKNDLTGVIHDIEDAKSKMTPQEYRKYLDDLNKESSASLPQMQIEGTTVQGGKHKLVVNDEGHQQTATVDAHEASRLGGPVLATQKDVHGHSEKRGDVAVDVNDKGEITSVTARSGDVFDKGPDGKWSVTHTDGTKETVAFENVNVDAKGNLSYDQGFNHIVQGADGSLSNEDRGDGQKILWDKNGKVLEASGGDGLTRKFNYDDQGQLDQVDGRLGHWDRKTDEAGNVQWVNKDNGEVWKGDMTVDRDGNIHYKSRDGKTEWTFTRDGRDVQGNEDYFWGLPIVKKSR